MLSLVRALASCFSARLSILRGTAGLVAGDRRVDVEARVQDLQVALAGEAGHGLAVAAAQAGTPPRAAAAKPVVAAGHLEAGREALEVPLEGAGEGLVEVVDVEDQRALGSGEAAEVGEVGVAAELDVEAGRRRGGEVGGHQGGALGRRRRARPACARSGSAPARARLALGGQDPRVRPPWLQEPRSMTKARITMNHSKP